MHKYVDLIAVAVLIGAALLIQHATDAAKRAQRNLHIIRINVPKAPAVPLPIPIAGPLAFE
jgi:hypothetical protein